MGPILIYLAIVIFGARLICIHSIPVPQGVRNVIANLFFVFGAYSRNYEWYKEGSTVQQQYQQLHNAAHPVGDSVTTIFASHAIATAFASKISRTHSNFLAPLDGVAAQTRLGTLVAGNGRALPIDRT
eukprot:TRINITY_DN1676_c0_g1_i2.p3 TRINITY_DN1676_c0_g1~~TRINITY_DN1676_c0_g1_i2.p3  ORF type:complete len:128 (-),score=17.47 TRINITY_DN1676_c0_g1_i2:1206-1589(-)